MHCNKYLEHSGLDMFFNVSKFRNVRLRSKETFLVIENFLIFSSLKIIHNLKTFIKTVEEKTYLCYIFVGLLFENCIGFLRFEVC